jgi:hypothetical protein
MEFLRTDKEILKIKEKYRTVLNKEPPPYNWDEFNGIEDYKKQMRKEIERK